MPLITVPTIDSVIFERFFECEWHMQAEDNWSHWYERQNLIKEIMEACGYASSASFVMLCRAHDIIFDRE